MDALVNDAPAQILANQTANWANQDVSYNNGYQAAVNKANPIIAGWKSKNAALEAKLSKMEEERDLAQADLESNLFSSREKSKMIAELKGAGWQKNWNDTIHKPAKDKIYFAHLKAKGYNV